MSIEVETIQRAGRAARYTGAEDRSDIDEIAQLIGEENVNRESPLPQVKDDGDRWVTLQFGWAVVLYPGNVRQVYNTQSYLHNLQERGQ